MKFPGMLEELALNAMVEADARKLDAVADDLARGMPVAFVARKAACHLRAMREVRRQLSLEPK